MQLAVWGSAVREEAQVHTNAYADDTKVMSEDVKKVQEGVRLTEEFGDLTGLQYAKTHAFSTARQGTKPTIRMYGETLEMKDTFRDLGAEVPERHEMRGVCKFCDEATETVDHVWVECKATASCRVDTEYRLIMSADRTGWPNCVRLGLLPPNFRLHPDVDNETMLGKMLKMLADVSIRRT